MLVVVVWAGVGLAADDLPFALGGDGAGGKVPAVAAPSCAAESVFGQQGVPNTGSWTALASDHSYDYILEDFWGVSEEICGIQWWGIFSEPSDGAPCDEPDPNYAVLFFDGSGTLVETFILPATKVDTGIDYSHTQRLYELRVTFPYCVHLSSGFVSVVSLGDASCRFYWLISPDGNGYSVYLLGGVTSYDFAMCLLTSPSCPDGSLESQTPGMTFEAICSDIDCDVYGEEWLAFDNFAAWGGSLSEPICDLRWWGTYTDVINCTEACSESQDTFEINFYEDDGGQPGDEVYSYRVTADRQNTGFTNFNGLPVYEFSADLPLCCPLTSGWVSIQGYGGNTDCWHAWERSYRGGDWSSYYWDGTHMFEMAPDLSLCLATAPDGDGDLVPDEFDDCPGTAAGDPVDGDGCSMADDDGDGVLNDQDACSDTPDCAVVDADGCPLDGDDDGVADGCDDCPNTAAGDPVDADGCSTADDDGDGVLNDDDLCANTPTCATNVDADGCAIDSDADGSPDGCPPAEQGCCGATGPVAPLGLAAGMLLLSRFRGFKGRTRRA